MKKLLSVAIFIVSSQVHAAPDMAQINTSLYSWNPKPVYFADGILSVQTQERRVTMEIYHALISYGICMSLLSNDKALDGIKEVRVLNSFKYQGMTFLGGAKECRVSNDAPSSNQQAILMGYTRAGVK